MGDRVVRRFLVVVVVLATAACGGVDRREPPSREPAQGTSPSEGTTPTHAAVQDLASIATLRERFEEDAGSTRLILILSPT